MQINEIIPSHLLEKLLSKQNKTQLLKNTWRNWNPLHWCWECVVCKCVCACVSVYVLVNTTLIVSCTYFRGKIPRFRLTWIATKIKPKIQVCPCFLKLMSYAYSQFISVFLGEVLSSLVSNSSLLWQHCVQQNFGRFLVSMLLFHYLVYFHLLQAYFLNHLFFITDLCCSWDIANFFEGRWIVTAKWLRVFHTFG